MTKSLLSGSAPGRLFPVSGVDMRLEPGRHSFEVAEEAAIAKNWSLEVAANPCLYNGDILLQETVVIAEGIVQARARLTNFATLLWWRKQQAHLGGRMMVASAVPVSADGAAIAIRMAPTTANAGKVYFAAGSLDRSDLREDGSVDFLGSMGRELYEETGLALDVAVADPVLYAVEVGNWFYVFRIFRFPWPAEEICSRVRHHIATDPDPEIDAVYALRDADLGAYRYDPLARVILPFFFGDQSNMAG